MRDVRARMVPVQAARRISFQRRHLRARRISLRRAGLFAAGRPRPARERSALGQRNGMQGARPALPRTKSKEPGMVRRLVLPAALLSIASFLEGQPAPTRTPPPAAASTDAPAPTPTPMIDLRFIRYKISAGDLPSAESILETHRAEKGEDDEYLLSLAWVARGAA